MLEDPDEWWSLLPLSRKRSIMTWLSQHDGTHRLPVHPDEQPFPGMAEADLEPAVSTTGSGATA